METLKIDGSSVSPRVYFSAKDRLLEISGYSRPENARDFYNPLIKWIEELKDWYKKNQSATSAEPFVFNFKYIYFNSSSAKFIFDIILQVSEIQKAGVPVNVFWYYDEDDDELREAGEELSEMAYTPLQFVEISH
ncbi:MAG: DUF1987 domain-containing protein [Bacteroidales bacterium]|jgi:hypothetical protein|nr:DUF1987 domain-containing protein [Bacteroidales bacterium]MDY0253539.1 DUF1987 domain-containing protein [Tenuifilaceae bacterium]